MKQEEVHKKQMADLRTEMLLNQAWMQGVLEEMKLKDEEIMQLEIKLLKTALIIEEKDDPPLDNDLSPLAGEIL